MSKKSIEIRIWSSSINYYDDLANTLRLLADDLEELEDVKTSYLRGEHPAFGNFEIITKDANNE